MRRQVMIRQGCVDGFSDADPVITVFRAFHMPSRLLMSYAGVSHNLLKRGMACSKPVISRRCRCSRCPARMSSTAGNGRLTLTLRWLRIVCI